MLIRCLSRGLLRPLISSLLLLWVSMQIKIGYSGETCAKLKDITRFNIDEFSMKYSQVPWSSRRISEAPRAVLIDKMA